MWRQKQGKATGRSSRGQKGRCVGITQWAQGNRDSFGCAERSLGFTQTKLPPLPSGCPARCKFWAGRFVATIPFHRGRQPSSSCSELSDSSHSPMCSCRLRCQALFWRQPSRFRKCSSKKGICFGSSVLGAADDWWQHIIKYKLWGQRTCLRGLVKFQVWLVTLGLLQWGGNFLQKQRCRESDLKISGGFIWTEISVSHPPASRQKCISPGLEKRTCDAQWLRLSYRFDLSSTIQATNIY